MRIEIVGGDFVGNLGVQGYGAVIFENGQADISPGMFSDVAAAAATIGLSIREFVVDKPAEQVEEAEATEESTAEQPVANVPPAADVETADTAAQSSDDSAAAVADGGEAAAVADGGEAAAVADAEEPVEKPRGRPRKVDLA